MLASFRASLPSRMPFRHLAVCVVASALALPPRAHAQSASAETGTIEGTVTLVERPPRRTLDRYAGGSPASRTLQQVPVVAYIEGTLPGDPPGAPPAGVQVAQRDTAFLPPLLVVPVGTTVAFPNRDPFFHNVISFSPAKRFDLGRYPRGESKSVDFDKPGVVRIYCEVHQFMRAAVLVVENPHHAIVGADGRFTLRGVPAGRHRLVIWDAERKPGEVNVMVTAGGVSRVSVSLR